MVGSIGTSGALRYLLAATAVVKKEKGSRVEGEKTVEVEKVVTPKEAELEPEPS